MSSKPSKLRFSARWLAVLSFSVIGCISLSRMGNRTDGDSPHDFFYGRAAWESSSTLMATDLKRGFEEEGVLVQVLPITGPLATALVNDQGKKDGASKKKLHERALLLSSVFVDGYTCFDVTVRNASDAKTPVKIASLSLRYANEGHAQNELEHGPLGSFEHQRLKFQKLLETYVAPPEGSGHLERKVLCGKHLQVGRPFQMTVSYSFSGKTKTHTLSWSSDEPLPGLKSVAKKSKKS